MDHPIINMEYRGGCKSRGGGEGRKVEVKVKVKVEVKVKVKIKVKGKGKGTGKKKVKGKGKRKGGFCEGNYGCGRKTGVNIYIYTTHIILW